MGDQFTRDPVFWIRDLDTLKVMTDPLRIQIMELLDPAPQTVNFVADKLGLASSRLYYHFNLLEKHGLIRVVNTRTVNNIIEKLYWVTAQDIEIQKDLMNYSSEEGPENIGRLVGSSLDATREDIIRSLEARKFNLAHGAKIDEKQLVANRIKKRLKDATYWEFVERLKGILTEFDDLPEEDEGEPGANVFSIACYLYPSYYYEEKTENQEGK